ncbi:protein tincar-like [Sergentomyia squamirostris]
MSITGSLVGYENNNEISGKKNRSLLNITSSSKQCPSLNSSISNSVITSSSASTANPKLNATVSMERKAANGRRRRFHFNSLWSIWYGILMTLLTGYLAIEGAHRFLVCSLLQWKLDAPFVELNIQIILCGFVFILLPFFFVTTVFKIGNLANDGVKLGSGAGRCSMEPPDGLEEEAKGGTLRALWTHGGPTSAFLHVVAALALLVPRLLLEARMIENGLLPKEVVKPIMFIREV